MIKKHKILPVIILGIIPILFLGIFYFYPLIGIFIKSFLSKGIFDFSGFSKVYHSNRIIKIIWFTFYQAGISSILTMIVALPCAFVISNFEFKGKKLIMIVATIPFVLPTIIVAAAFQALLGNNGLISFINIENSLYLIFFAHVFYNFSVVLRITSSFWSYIQKEITEAGYMLCATPFQVFYKITLPLLKPALSACFLLIFIFCFSSFGVVLILGGPGFSTIEVEIYRQAAHVFNLNVACVLSLIQIIFTFIMMWLYMYFQKRAVKFLPGSQSVFLKNPDFFHEKLMIWSCIIFILIFCFSPMAALIIKSLLFKGSFSLVFYKELFINVSNSIFYIFPGTFILNSLMYGVITLVIAVIIGVCAGFFIKSLKGKIGAIFDPLFMLPISTSAVTLGFGIIITLDKPPLNLRTSLILVPIAHTLVAFPFVLRAIMPALISIPNSLKNAASLLGASPFISWLCVDIPIIRRALTVGALFAFTISLGEFGATLFTANPEFSTMPIAIYKFLSQPGIMNYGQAMAVSSILMLVTGCGFFIIENIRDMGHEGF